jgi:hypothetical protein
VVYNRAGLSATVDRFITIISPCPDNKPNICPMDGQCHSVDCSTLATLSSLPGQAPEADLSSALLVLLPTRAATNWTEIELQATSGISLAASENRTLHVAYGVPAPMSLLPCTSSLAIAAITAECAAAAVQFNAANSSFVDAASQISVRDVTPNSTLR